MKRFENFRGRILGLAGLVAFFFTSALGVQVIDEVKTALQDPAMQGTPDPNNSFVWPIDLFAENIDPLSNGWQVTGGGSFNRYEVEIWVALSRLDADI